MPLLLFSPSLSNVALFPLTKVNSSCGVRLIVGLNMISPAKSAPFTLNCLSNLVSLHPQRRSIFEALYSQLPSTGVCAIPHRYAWLDFNILSSGGVGMPLSFKPSSRSSIFRLFGVTIKLANAGLPLPDNDTKTTSDIQVVIAFARQLLIRMLKPITSSSILRSTEFSAYS